MLDQQANRKRRRRGRPSKLTWDTINCVVSAVERGVSRAKAAKMAGVDERTLRLWRRKGRESNGSSPHRYLLGHMDAAHARHAERRSSKLRTPKTRGGTQAPKLGESFPRELLGSTMLIKDEGRLVRVPIELDLAAIQELYDASEPAGPVTLLNPDGSRVWLLLRNGRPGFRTTFSIVALMSHHLRIDVIDGEGVPCTVEFRSL